MRPELRVCVQNFVYASRFSNIVKRVVKSLVYRQQQFRLCVTFNNAMLAVQLVTSSRISSKKLRLCVNFQITASTRAGVNQCSIAFTTVGRAGNVVRMARASSWPDKSRQQR